MEGYKTGFKFYVKYFQRSVILCIFFNKAVSLETKEYTAETRLGGHMMMVT